MLLGLIRVVYLGITKTDRTHNLHNPGGFGYKPLQHLLSALRDYGWLWIHRPFYSFIATLFHVGLVTVPLFVAAHVIQWKEGVGFSWWALPQHTADLLTLLVLVTAPLIFITHLSHIITDGGQLSMRMFWPLLLTIPYLTGYLCVNGDVSPKVYHASLLIHVYSGNLLMLALAFTRAANCLLEPVTEICHAQGDILKVKWRRYAQVFNREKSDL